MAVTTKSIGKAWQSVKVFNEVANNLNNVDELSLDNQISFIFSELEETITAIESGNKVELLDGACDLFVTVAGLMQKLEVAGFDVDEALQRVNENNMSKYIPASETNFEKFVDKNHKATLNKKHSVYVIKDGVGKIRKPTNFVSVNISDCVPKGFVLEGVK